MNYTQNEINFLKSCNEENGCAYDDADWDSIGKPVETAETVEDFKNSAYDWQGLDTFQSESGLELTLIHNFQRFKGDTRRTIKIADFGDKRLVLA